MGRLIKQEDIVPDLILSSTAVRAKTTAEIVAEASEYPGEIRLDRRLYLGGPSAIIGVLREIGDAAVNRVMIVGHNPDQEELIKELTGREERFPTAALARIDLPIESWKELEPQAGGNRVHIWRPKELDG